MSSSIDRLARFAALRDAQKLGWLEGHTKTEIASALGVDRTTIFRFLQKYRNYEEAYSKNMAILENLKSKK
jgi:DNA invertase Pin-like site-specific DNA recombinase